MVATHTAHYDQVVMFGLLMGLVIIALACLSVRLLRGRHWGRRAAGVALAVAAVAPGWLALDRAAEARFRNRCVDHNSDIPLCSGRQLAAPGVPVDEWEIPAPPTDIPATPPDDPSAYRGLRVEFNIDGAVIAGRHVPWLQRRSGGLRNDSMSSAGTFYGTQEVSDGRREMFWLTRTDAPLDPYGRYGRRSEEHIVLDVLVRPSTPPGTELVGGCAGAAEVLAVAPPDGSEVLDAWLFDPTAARIRPIEPDGIRCGRFAATEQAPR